MTQVDYNRLTPRGRRALKKRQPQVKEDPKVTLFVKGTSTSGIIKQAMRDLTTLTRPYAKPMTHKNPIRPFEDAGSLEFFSKMNNAGGFVFGSHTKKRPHSLTFGRFFDEQILDMFEFQIDPVTFMSSEQFAAERETIVRVASKPLFVFQGDAFESVPQLKRFKSLILDLFRGDEVKELSLMGIDRVIVCTAAVNPANEQRKVFFRHYGIAKKRSGTRVPRVELEEVGPRMDLLFNRASTAPKEVLDASMMVPHELYQQKKKKKNVEEGLLGTTLGRVHMQKQNLKELALAKLKGLGKRKNANSKLTADLEGGAAANGEGEVALGTRRPRATIPRAIVDTGRNLSGEAALQENRDKSFQPSTKRVKKLPAGYVNAVTME